MGQYAPIEYKGYESADLANLTGVQSHPGDWRKRLQTASLEKNPLNILFVGVQFADIFSAEAYFTRAEGGGFREFLRWWDW